MKNVQRILSSVPAAFAEEASPRKCLGSNTIQYKIDFVHNFLKIVYLKSSMWFYLFSVHKDGFKIR